MAQCPRWGCRSASCRLLYGINLSEGYLFVPCRHVGLKFGDVVIAQHDGFLFVVVTFEDGWEEVAGRLALRITHGEDGCISTFCHELVLQSVSTAVASDDTADFPELEVV